MSAAGPPQEKPPESAQNIAATLAEVSERASVLVREEIELAKAEVSEKARTLIRGTIVGAAAGVFVLSALVFVLVGCAWLLTYFLPFNAFAYFWGFFAMAAILLVLGGLAGLIAARAVKRSAPPVPQMAIEEARKIRETVSRSDGAAGAAASSPSAAAGASSSAAGASQRDTIAEGGR